MVDLDIWLYFQRRALNYTCLFGEYLPGPNVFASVGVVGRDIVALIASPDLNIRAKHFEYVVHQSEHQVENSYE